MWMLALMLGGSAAVAAPPGERLPDRALLEFLAEFDEAGRADDIDPLWLASADAAAELDQGPVAAPETDIDAETDDDRPR